MKISVCTDMVYQRLSTATAMDHVKAVGADAVEFWQTEGKDLNAIAAASRTLGLPAAVFCGPSLSMIAPDSPVRYPEALKKTVDACELLGCRRLIACSGPPQWGWSPAEMHERLWKTVEACVTVLEAHDLTLLLEPLNASELSYLRSSREVFDLCRIINNPRVQVLYDFYHMQLMEGNLINTIRTNAKWIGHFHAADLPGRTAPGLGEINYPNIMRTLRNSEYKGYLGLEYIPAADCDNELIQVLMALRST